MVRPTVLGRCRVKQVWYTNEDIRKMDTGWRRSQQAAVLSTLLPEGVVRRPPVFVRIMGVVERACLGKKGLHYRMFSWAAGKERTGGLFQHVGYGYIGRSGRDPDVVGRQESIQAASARAGSRRESGAWGGGGDTCGQVREVTPGFIMGVRRQNANSGIDAPWVVRCSLLCIMISSWLFCVDELERGRGHRACVMGF